MLAAASPERKDALPSPEGTDTPSVARPIPPERRGYVAAHSIKPRSIRCRRFRLIGLTKSSFPFPWNITSGKRPTMPHS